MRITNTLTKLQTLALTQISIDKFNIQMRIMGFRI